MTNESHDKALNDYLESLDVDALNSLLGKVLSQLRVRENGQMQVDVITKSQRMRLQTRNISTIGSGSRAGQTL
jgi:hypothetical protein